VKLEGQVLMTVRIIVKIATGKEVDTRIFNSNGIKTDNRLCNLHTIIDGVNHYVVDDAIRIAQPKPISPSCIRFSWFTERWFFVVNGWHSGFFSNKLDALRAFSLAESVAEFEATTT
jgi:hypothetical protein